MRLKIRRSDWFIGDLEHYANWRQTEAGWEVAERYLNAIRRAVTRLADLPGLGRQARFTHPALNDLSRNHAVEMQRLPGLFAQGLRRAALPDP